MFNDLSTTASDVSTLQPIRDPEFLINVFILLVSSAMLLSQETTTKVTALAQQSDKTDLQNTKHSLLNTNHPIRQSHSKSHILWTDRQTDKNRI